MTCIDKEGKEYIRDKEHEPLGFKFKLIHEGFANMLNKQLRDEDMTFSQMILVSYLWENKDKKITQKDISQALQIKHPTTIGLLKRLEDKEMVKVVVDPDNRKYRNVAITSKIDINRSDVFGQTKSSLYQASCSGQMIVWTLSDKDEVINRFPINIIGGKQFLCCTNSQVAGSLTFSSDMSLLDTDFLLNFLYCPLREHCCNLLIVQNLLW